MKGLLKKLDPYYRLGRYDKPIGGWLVFWPSAYGIVLASPGTLMDPFIYGSVFASCFLLRSAHCAINDFWDRNLDKHVERTKTRPLASGELSVPQGLAFFTSQMVPIPIMWYLVGSNAAWVVPTTIPILTLYPLAKRFLPWPQTILGIAMNWNILLYHAILTNSVPLYIWPLYTGLWCWTMIYDSIYAFQDLKDDLKVGNNSTAVAWQEKYEKYCDAFAMGMGANMLLGGYLAGLGPMYYPMMGISVAHAMYTYKSLDTSSTKDCWNKFSMHQYTGILMFIAFILGKVKFDSNKDQEKVLEIVS
jgi:4-hydroxybenzoate polyprenyl transferase